MCIHGEWKNPRFIYFCQTHPCERGYSQCHLPEQKLALRELSAPVIWKIKNFTTGGTGREKQHGSRQCGDADSVHAVICDSVRAQSSAGWAPPCWRPVNQLDVSQGNSRSYRYLLCGGKALLIKACRNLWSVQEN